MLHLFFLKKIKKSIDKHTKLAYNVLVKTSRMYPFSPYGEGFAVEIVLFSHERSGGALGTFGSGYIYPLFVCLNGENFEEGFT